MIQVWGRELDLHIFVCFHVFRIILNFIACFSEFLDLVSVSCILFCIAEKKKNVFVLFLSTQSVT